MEFESIAEAVRTLNPNATNFDGDCATLSHCASGSGFYKQYLARNENSNYQLTTRNIQVYNSVTGEIFSNVKDAVKKTNNSSWMIKKWASDEANKEWFYLNDCARVKLRESGKTFS